MQHARVSASRRSSFGFTESSQTYTNMAITQAGKMLSSLRCSLYLLVLGVSGIHSSTLHLHPEQRYMLPQNRGFFTMEANKDLTDGDGGGAAAPGLPLAGSGAAQRTSGSGAHLEHRRRRSTGELAMPKVYGQVMFYITMPLFTFI